MYVGTGECGEESTNVLAVGEVISAVKVVETSGELKLLEQFVRQIETIDDLG